LYRPASARKNMEAMSPSDPMASSLQAGIDSQ
jgi:hypothetical protein